MKYFIILLSSLAIGAVAAFSQDNPLPADSVGASQVTGTVVDTLGDPVIGASVTVKNNLQKSTMTDVDGKFTIAGLPANSVVQITYIGFSPKTVKVATGTSDYRIVMTANNSMLDEVVVVGYATRKKVDMTGAVSSISASTLEDRPITNATNALAGLAAGLTVTNSGGNTPGYESQSILVRGQGTLNNAAPLVVVDGMTGIALSDINPQDIENISILKDAASASIYGSRAANGVILVTTRNGAERGYLQRQRVV